MDLGFVLSGNTDQKNIFAKQRDAVIEMIRRIPVSSRNNKVGYVTSDKIQPLTSDESKIIRNLQTSSPSKSSDIKEVFEKSMELFQKGKGARDDKRKVLVAFVNDEVLNYDVSKITPMLRNLKNQGVKVILLQPPKSLSLDLLPSDVAKNVDRVDVDSNNAKSIMEKLLNQRNEGNKSEVYLAFLCLLLSNKL